MSLEKTEFLYFNLNTIMQDVSREIDSVILLVTDKATPSICHLYNELCQATIGVSKVFVAYHKKEDSLPALINDLNHFIFDDSVLTELGYLFIGDKLVPGNNHFPLLKFFRENNKYNQYWVIEDDVRFTGKWNSFFEETNRIDADFVSCMVRHWQNGPQWHWWHTLKHDYKIFPLKKRLASFNPVYRISYNALYFIDFCLKDKWQGHHEVLYPSLLKYGGYKIADFGGDGDYVPQGFENKFYCRPNSCVNGVVTDGTMRFKPQFGFCGHLDDKLYHPVKCFDERAELFYTTSSSRMEWIEQMDKIARPVVESLANQCLKEEMPQNLSIRIDNSSERKEVVYLEAFGRTLSGIAPWMNSESGSNEEKNLRNLYRKWSLKAIENAVDPQSKDYLVWEGGQALVDASYFALALIRCPWLWENIRNDVRDHVLKALMLTRNTTPVYTNWILFSGLIETFFLRYGYGYDSLRIEYCVREFMEHWYVGDGMFSDGMPFHLDYYNSYVIQPYLSTIFEVDNIETKRYNGYFKKFELISKRYAQIQERMINNDGSFPVFGRSVAYRTGAFHHLANVALKRQLPDTLKPSQVREALFAVIKKTLQAPSTFDENGWLKIGLCGAQQNLADFYITTGSLYMCMNIFLPLGLPSSDPFWYCPGSSWTSLKLWNGLESEQDKALDFKENLPI